MPYSKSRARQEFDLNCSKLYALAKKVSYKSSPLGYDHKQLINQSCIFLLSARIEEYTQSIVEDLVFLFKQEKANLEQVPMNTRAKALVDSQINYYRTFYNSSDERKLLKNITSNVKYFELMDDSVAFEKQIHKTNIIGTKKYPSVKNLKILYNRLGIKDVVEELNKKSKKDVKTYLESFLSMRESIAHQGAPTITFRDIQRHFKNIGIVVKTLDRVLYSHIVKVSGAQFWNSEKLS